MRIRARDYTVHTLIPRTSLIAPSNNTDCLLVFEKYLGTQPIFLSMAELFILEVLADMKIQTFVVKVCKRNYFLGY